MPTRRKGEPLREYVSRCVTTRRHEHPEESAERSVAACISMGKSWWKSKKSGARKGK